MEQRTVAPENIEIKPRQRKILAALQIEKMAESIHKFGLFSPPVMIPGSAEGKFQLVAGFTRLQGMLFLRWKEIPFNLKDEVDEITLKEMELEENIQRTDLEWWEKAEAVAEIYEMRVAKDPTWSMRKTAELTGEALGTVSQSVQLRNEIKENPEIKTEKTLRGALQRLDVKKKLIEKRKDIERRSKGLTPSLRAEILVGDAVDLIKKEPDESYDAIVTNLPFGVDLKFKSGLKPYEDGEALIIETVQAIVKESFRVLKDDSWFVAWFDIRKITYSNAQLALYKRLAGLTKLKDFQQMFFDSMGLNFWLEDAGFSYVTLVPALWVKPNKTQGMIGDPRKGLIVAAEAMVFASKGGAFFMKQGRNNVFIYDSLGSAERDYSMQMPAALCTEIVSMVSLSGGRILDPFAGSGSIGLGALNRECEFRGYEINPEAAQIGNMLLSAHHLAAQEKGDA